MSGASNGVGDHSTPRTRALSAVTSSLGSTWAILLAVLLVAAWVVGGFFVEEQFSNQLYQLIINTVTQVITFIMVFVIQNTQNRESRAQQAKLDAQNKVLLALAQHFGVSETEEPVQDLDAQQLARFSALETAPQDIIEREHQEVRQELGQMISEETPRRSTSATEEAAGSGREHPISASRVFRKLSSAPDERER